MFIVSCTGWQEWEAASQYLKYEYKVREFAASRLVVVRHRPSSIAVHFMLTT